MSPINFVKECTFATANFIYETPINVIVCLVAGVALLILFPPCAPPLLGYAAAALGTRILSKIIIQSTDLSVMAKTNEQLDEFHSKYGKIRYAILAASLAAAVASPLAGILIAGGTGIYEGFISEVEITKLKQNFRREQKLPPTARQTLCAL